MKFWFVLIFVSDFLLYHPADFGQLADLFLVIFGTEIKNGYVDDVFLIFDTI